MALREVDGVGEENEAEATSAAQAEQQPAEVAPLSIASDANPPSQPSEKPTGISRAWQLFALAMVVLLIGAVVLIAEQARTNDALTAEIGGLEETLSDAKAEAAAFEQQITQVHEGLLSLASQVGALTEITAGPGREALTTPATAAVSAAPETIAAEDPIAQPAEETPAQGEDALSGAATGHDAGSPDAAAVQGNQGEDGFAVQAPVSETADAFAAEVLSGDATDAFAADVLSGEATDAFAADVLSGDATDAFAAELLSRDAGEAFAGESLVGDAFEAGTEDASGATSVNHELMEQLRRAAESGVPGQPDR